MLAGIVVVPVVGLSPPLLLQPERMTLAKIAAQKNERDRNFVFIFASSLKIV
jgi:hypothetical protein